MRTAKNLINHEMIGLETSVIESTDFNITGLNGTIIDETKNMFVIQTKNGIKRIQKSICRFSFNVENQDVEIDGKKLGKRPEERLVISA